MPIKKDGHTHSQFCHHGSPKKTAESVQHAINLGFTEISVTEHAPLPDGYIEDPVIFSEHNLIPEEIDPYIAHLKTLKTDYSHKIKVNIGFEFDYLPDTPDVTLNQIEELGGLCEDRLLSLHYVSVKGKAVLLDYNPTIFREALIKPLGGIFQVYTAYLHDYLNLVKFAGTLPYKVRLSHPMLVWKFSRVIPLTAEEQIEAEQIFITRIIPEIVKNDLEVDYNVAGIDVQDCGKPYLSDSLVMACRQKGIKLVYGSDAHSPDKVGRYYHLYEQLMSQSIST